MKSQTIFEFKNLITCGHNQIVYWESPRLSTAFPIDGQPAGSDRAICRTVNAFARVNYVGKIRPIFAAAALYGEYAGISGLIRESSISVTNTQPATLDFSRNGNGFCFDQFITYSNLVERVFVRFCFVLNDQLNSNSVQLDVSGVLIASDPEVS